VIEQAPKLSAVSLGGGLHIWSNGMRALRSLGVADDVAALGGDESRLRSAEFYTRTTGRPSKAGVAGG
jgi:2-polyprenyl-6-methoxyphenol hydroxylase-like FAD-dependent oxidoreductase